MKCPRCEGTGKLSVERDYNGLHKVIVDCYECDGTGEV